MTNKAILERDKSRNIGEELLAAIQDVKRGRIGARYTIQPNDVVNARLKTGLSQTEFASARFTFLFAPCNNGNKVAGILRGPQKPC